MSMGLRTTNKDVIEYLKDTDASLETLKAVYDRRRAELTEVIEAIEVQKREFNYGSDEYDSLLSAIKTLRIERGVVSYKDYKLADNHGAGCAYCGGDIRVRTHSNEFEQEIRVRCKKCDFSDFKCL